MKYFVGLDVSLAETAVCIVDDNNVVVREAVVPSHPEPLADYLDAVGYEIRKVGLEAGTTAPWIYNGLRERGYNAICIDARKLRAITKTMPIKTDRNDARAIASCMRVGWYSVVHVKSDESQEMRMLLVNRRTLQIKQIDLENEIRGTLKVFGLKILGRVTSGPFEGKVLEIVQGLPRIEAMVRPMLIARAALRQQCAVLQKMVLDLVRKNEVCKRLMTVPGVGAITAITYFTTIDDPDRFHRSRDVGPHLGLVPKKYASGETDRNSGISKSGDSAMRTVLYQAALALLTRSTKMSSLRSWGLAVAKRRGLRRAIVAVARKLAIVMHRIWSDGTVFRWSKAEFIEERPEVQALPV